MSLILPLTISILFKYDTSVEAKQMKGRNDDSHMKLTRGARKYESQKS